jgi:hypothetical protein
VVPIVPTTVEFVDIAGLVKGASSRGEGLGNQFLAHIREVAAIAHVVRCFEDPNVVHVSGRVDPLADIETIETELALADLATLERRAERMRKGAKGGDDAEALRGREALMARRSRRAARRARCCASGSWRCPTTCTCSPPSPSSTSATSPRATCGAATRTSSRSVQATRRSRGRRRGGDLGPDRA